GRPRPAVVSQPHVNKFPDHKGIVRGSSRVSVSLIRLAFKTSKHKSEHGGGKGWLVAYDLRCFRATMSSRPHTPVSLETCRQRCEQVFECCPSRRWKIRSCDLLIRSAAT